LVDKHSQEVRSQNMRAVKSKNTKPELQIRKHLHSLGYRYRLHSKKLPGKPDLVIQKYNTAIFINGCFWHGHDCPAFTWPKTRSDFWKEKISGNIKRDADNINQLSKLGWRVMIIWECALKGKEKLDLDDIGKNIVTWLASDRQTMIIRGKGKSDSI